MGEMITYQVRIIMRSGRIIEIGITDLELGWIFDRMFGREVGNFQNLNNVVVNINEIEFMEFNAEVSDNGI